MRRIQNEWWKREMLTRGIVVSNRIEADSTINFLVIATGYHLDESVPKWTSCGTHVDRSETKCIGALHLFPWHRPLSPRSDGFFLPILATLCLLAFSGPRCVFSPLLGPTVIARVLMYSALQQCLKEVSVYIPGLFASLGTARKRVLHRLPEVPGGTEPCAH